AVVDAQISDLLLNQPPASKVRLFLVSRIHRAMWHVLGIFFAYSLVKIPDWFRMGIGPYQALPISFPESVFLLGTALLGSIVLILIGGALSKLRHRDLTRRMAAWNQAWQRRIRLPQAPYQLTSDISTSINRLLVRWKEWAYSEEAMSRLDRQGAIRDRR